MGVLKKGVIRYVSISEFCFFKIHTPGLWILFNVFIQTNTFQAVLITNGQHSFTIYHYVDIQWTGTGNSTTGLGGTPAQVDYQHVWILWILHYVDSLFFIKIDNIKVYPYINNWTYFTLITQAKGVISILSLRFRDFLRNWLNLFNIMQDI